MTDRPTRRRTAPGFTLPAVMVVAAAMLILAVGLLSIIGIERKTARSFSDSKRAELAARAGLEDFRAVLRAETANDDYLVIGGTPERTPPEGKEAPPHLFLARGSGGGDSVRYRYLPLFSTNTLPPDGTTLEAPEVADGEGNAFTPIAGPPWLDQPRVEWIQVKDEEGEIVARYAYWVEDLQGKLDATTAGNDDGQASGNDRGAWPFPAPGVNPDEDKDKADRVAIHVLDPAATEDGDGKLFRRIEAGRTAMLSPESVVAAAGFEAPLERESDTGLLADPLAAALEKSTSPVIRSYLERATVPFAPGIAAEAAGQPKRNLNALLGKARPAAVDEFASWIDTALPDFDNRKGGFPDDYLRTLAANALDYADADNDPTLSGTTYRGLDGYPLVSEFLMTFRWDSTLRENGRTYVMFTVGTFVELWNMTDQPVNGDAQVSFETKFDFQLGANPGVSFEEASQEPDAAIPVPVSDQGYLWHPVFRVSLQPNEMRVYPFRIQLKIDAGPASLFVASPLQIFSNQYDRESGYRFRWNGQVVDQSRNQMWKSGGSVHYPDDTKAKSRQFVRATIPGHSHASRSGPDDFRNNMGDPRMSFYLADPQTRNNYPNNYSPHRRNVRWDNVYKNDGGTKPLVYGRVLPSEWPDLGHDAPHGARPTMPTDDQRVMPDDPSFLTNLPTPVREQAPVRLSNLGRFYSATELGRAYDPVMWQPTYLKAAETNNIRAGTLPSNQTAWPDVNPSSPSSASYGGGNTLRIGRAEHPKFEQPGWHAAHLLDLFTAGESTSNDTARREGTLVPINGQVNLNTATPDAIRALAAGTLRQDPALCETTSKTHQVTTLMAAPTKPLELGSPKASKIADRVADAIVRSRPFASAADIASASVLTGTPAKETAVFGNRDLYTQGNKIHWTDSAAEEVFARLYEASTLRSRNFRIWVIGQAIVPPRPGSNAEPEILSESKKVFTVFADPGERTDDGGIDPASYRPRVTHENDF